NTKQAINKNGNMCKRIIIILPSDVFIHCKIIVKIKRKRGKIHFFLRISRQKFLTKAGRKCDNTKNDPNAIYCGAAEHENADQTQDQTQRTVDPSLQTP
ncbi:MAG: hypothetical protein RBT66_09270, partial [bacterium]|nr:hypothetical protein [bacterium]